jgi:hypothetical protein
MTVLTVILGDTECSSAPANLTGIRKVQGAPNRNIRRFKAPFRLDLAGLSS